MTTADTIKVMTDLARGDANAATVRAYAEQVRARAEERSAQTGENINARHYAEAVEELTRARIAYVPDPEEYELVRAPDYMLAVDPRGDCDDHATLIAATLIALGFDPQFARLGYGIEDVADPYSHVVVVLHGPANGYPRDIVIDSTTRPDAQGSMLANTRTAAAARVRR